MIVCIDCLTAGTRNFHHHQQKWATSHPIQKLEYRVADQISGQQMKPAERRETEWEKKLGVDMKGVSDFLCFVNCFHWGSAKYILFRYIIEPRRIMWDSSLGFTLIMLSRVWFLPIFAARSMFYRGKTWQMTKWTCLSLHHLDTEGFFFGAKKPGLCGTDWSKN